MLRARNGLKVFKGNGDKDKTYMIRRYVFLLITLTIIFSSCVSQRAPGPGFGFEFIFPWMERDESKYPAYNILTSGTAEEAEALLKAGQNPNKVRHPYWESSWSHRNPLWMTAGNYNRAKLLIQYGADVTKRPYIAKVMDRKIISERYPDEMLVKGMEDRKELINVIYEDFLYEKVKLYLEAGADPNMKGSFSSHASFIQTESHYRRLYNKYGRLPITWAIKYSAFSIVELLLDYGAILDEKSLEYAKEATELSGHRDMEDYIKEVWEKQQVLNIRKK
jgi:hypothetical protein